MVVRALIWHRAVGGPGVSIWRTDRLRRGCRTSLGPCQAALWPTWSEIGVGFGLILKGDNYKVRARVWVWFEVRIRFTGMPRVGGL